MGAETEILIRQETEKDHAAVSKIIEDAFKTIEYSDHREHFLVERLRSTKAFIPELSLVAVRAGELIGHILLTKIEIRNDGHSSPALALAPVSVAPQYQGQGIGGELIREAHRIAGELGHRSVVLLGHAEYYPRFGYRPLAEFNIKLPFEAPPENCMLLELVPGGAEGVSGEVIYDPAFFG